MRFVKEMSEVLGDEEYMNQLGTPMHSRASSWSGGEVSGRFESGWRDADVVHVEVDVDSDGEHYHSYVIEVTASDGTNWQV